MYKYLKDKPFLNEIDNMKTREQYVKITVLDFFQERPIREIQGRATGGNINIDGHSAIRRTCNLTVQAEEQENDLTDIDNLFSLNKKVKIEIGFKNFTKYYQEYDIIWFPLGVYVIINPSISHSSSGANISLQLKDKMCLLNGECGGLFPASTTLHEYETIDKNGAYVIEKPTMYQIIQEVVNHFGGEQLSKILISDLSEKLKQVMKWTGSNPLYLVSTADQHGIGYYATVDTTDLPESAVAYEYGRDVGFINVKAVFPGELIANEGDSVCTILDKIVEVLGNYEYFYDIYGNFIFQEIKNYLNTSQSTVELNNLTNQDYQINQSNGKAVYVFDNSNLIISYSNTPQYHKIKNDFVIWGIRKTATGMELPIRYHLAIDEKPKIGNTYQRFFYEEDGISKAKYPLIFNSKAEFPSIGEYGSFYMDKSTNEIYNWDTKNQIYSLVTSGLENITTADWRSELYLSGSKSELYGTNGNYYFTELSNEWTKLYDLKNQRFYSHVINNPVDIDYFLDFIDSEDTKKLSIANIGRRSIVEVDSKINCVFEPEIPDFIIINIDEDASVVEQKRKECELKGQRYIQVQSHIYNALTIGGNFNSAYNRVKELLHEYTSYNENISIEALPIYYLEPNTRITVKDKVSGINGDYMINSISLPLDIRGSMNLNCTRALQKI